jgi:hypothetical protein
MRVGLVVIQDERAKVGLNPTTLFIYVIKRKGEKNGN